MSELTRGNLLEYLLSKTEPITESGCLIWNDVIDHDGYARQWHEGKNLRVHRIVFNLTHGELPRHLVPDHLCRVRCCLNVNHMEPVTWKENVLRGIGITAENARKTHCNNGHAFEGNNLGSLGQKSDHQRICRKCGALRQAKYMKRKQMSNE